MDQIIYDILPEESAHEFVKRVPPSTTPRSETEGLLHVYKSGRCTENEDVLIEEGKKLLEKHTIQIRLASSKPQKRNLIRQLYVNILNLAKSCNHLEGRWLWCVSNKSVDHYWQLIVQEMLNGKLGPCAKVLLKEDKYDNHRLISIYTKDFTDIDDLSRVYRTLIGIEKNGKFEYKISALSRLAINRRNPYGLPLIMYTNCGGRMLKCDEDWLPTIAQNMFETPEDFVKRMPPSKTMATNYPASEGYICFDNGRSNPENLEEFQRQAQRLLNLYPAHSLDPKMNEETVKLREFKQSVEELALSCNVIQGKWTLSVDEEEIDSIWLKTVKGVKQGRYGTGAQVQMGTNLWRHRKRTMFIYTKDFTDMEDIHRVLNNMKSDGLLSNTNPIYYTPDAFTHLGIDRESKINIRALSLSSDNFLVAH